MKPNQQTSRRPLVENPPHARSRVSNGKDILPGVDLRSAVARRYRDLFAGIASDQGGVERLSEVRLQLIRRFASLSIEAEQAEARLVSGDTVDVEKLCQLSSTLVRLSQRIGIDRRARNITPTLAEYLANKTVEQEPAE